MTPNYLYTVCMKPNQSPYNNILIMCHKAVPTICVLMTSLEINKKVLKLLLLTSTFIPHPNSFSANKMLTHPAANDCYSNHAKVSSFLEH